MAHVLCPGSHTGPGVEPGGKAWIADDNATLHDPSTTCMLWLWLTPMQEEAKARAEAPTERVHSSSQQTQVDKSEDDNRGYVDWASVIADFF